MGFGPILMEWVQLLYIEPTARVCIGNALSRPFRLERGTSQGCPLSPLLFAIAMEPLAENICSETKVKGFIREAREEKVALANDVLIFWGDVDASLAPVLKVIGNYRFVWAFLLTGRNLPYCIRLEMQW